MNTAVISKVLCDNITLFDGILGKGVSYDVIRTNLKTGTKDACYYYVDGYVNPQSIIKVHEISITAEKEKVDACQNMSDYVRSSVPYHEVDIENSVSLLVDAFLNGNCIFFIDGFDEAAVFDLRNSPERGIEEPEKNKTIRGPKDGFSENITKNTVMIRRRVKTPDLKFEAFDVGEKTKIKVSLAYIADKADKNTVDMIRKRLQNMNLNCLSMTQEVLAEKLFSRKKSRLWNPFPKVRYIDRPDTAGAMLLEGKILVICDTTPSVICVPVCIYDFFEETDDYYFPPLVALYLKIIRMLVFACSVYLVPGWLLLLKYSHLLPENWSFLLIDEEYSVPVVLQLLIIEFAIDGLKLASLNTPSTLSNSLSVVGGLLLGDFAVKSGWFVSQTILYSAFTAIANFVPVDYELGYCFKFQRMILIVLSWFFGIYGFAVGTILGIVILALNRSVDNKSYLYPIIPFNRRAFVKLFVKGGSGSEELK